MSKIKKCSEHPKYQGLRKPRSGCKKCEEIYEINNPDIGDELDVEIIEAKYKREAQRSKKRQMVLIERMKDLQDQLDVIEVIQNNSNPIKIRAKGSFKKGHSEAVAVIILSDWHVGEFVDPKTVNGKNSFNVEICKKRVDLCFQNGLRLVNMLAKDVNIDTIMLACLGDFITNYLHDDNRETNTLAPGPEVVEAFDRLLEGIEFLLNNSKYKLVIPCCFGNHARMTDRKRSANLVGTSHEYVIYHLLTRQFRGNERVQFDIAEGMHLYSDVFGMKLRFHHGDKINFWGGVGGLEIPLRKSLMQWDKVERVDFDILGHWHQTKIDWNKYVVNGSLIGWNTFALGIKADFEPPRQTLVLLDRDRGLTVACPIILSEIQRKIVQLR